MICLQTLSQILIYLNCAVVYFTSKVYHLLFVEGNDEISSITVGWDLTKFLLMVVIVEHFLLILKVLIEQTVEDVPYEVVRGLRVKSTLIENFNEIKAAGSQYVKPCDNKGITEAKNALKNDGLFTLMEAITQEGKDGK